MKNFAKKDIIIKWRILYMIQNNFKISVIQKGELLTQILLLKC